MRDGYEGSTLTSDDEQHTVTVRYATREQADAAQAWLADGVPPSFNDQPKGGA